MRLVALLITWLPFTVYAAGPRGQYTSQLAGECDALSQAAVKRPFGWGWDNVAPEATANATAPRHVTFEPANTPAAGLLLLWAGQLLDEPKYRQAALQAARGAAAAQMTSGKIPEHAIFGNASASSRETQQFVPDRSATRAAMTLMLSVIESESNKPEALMRSAQRAAQWLIKQQTEDGGWPLAYPPDALPHETQRLLKLDESDYRDNTLAMLLAADVINDPATVKAPSRAISKLIAIRLGASEAATTQPDDAPPVIDLDIARRTSNLWATAYRLNGSFEPRLDQFPAGADMVASRLSVQTLIAAYLVNGDRNAGQALESARRSLVELKLADGNWHRLYLLQPMSDPTERVEVGNLFRTASTQPTKIAATFGLPLILEGIDQLKVLGRQRYLTMLNGPMSLHQRLAAAVCGLGDEPFALDLPLTKAEVDGYVKQHESDWQSLTRPIPQELSARVQRIWFLLIRARLEQMQQQP